MKEFIASNANETVEIGYQLGLLLKPGDTILLEGNLSGGKTTFTKGIGKALNIKRIINSPTFTILKEYQGKYPLYHMDLYRLDENSHDYDLENYINGDGITVIEWPFQAPMLLPDEYLLISFSILENGSRKITLEAKGNHYEELLGELK